MPATIGILGESTVVTNGVITTIYTVPVDRGARVRLLFAMEGGGAATGYALYIGTPGNDNLLTRALGVSEDTYSGINAGGSKASNLVGVVDAGTAVLDISDPILDKLIMLYPHDYFLSAGDTVRFQISGGDAVDHLIQVHGVEDDV